MKIYLKKIKHIVFILTFVISVTACIETTPDSPYINPEEINLSDTGFVYPKASKDWNQYIGLFQKDAVSKASRKAFWPDDNTITYLRSYEGIFAGDVHIGYVWSWVSQGRDIVFISEMIDNSGIANILVINKNKLPIDEIIKSFTADNYLKLLGEENVDYLTHIWDDYSTESKNNLHSEEYYITVKENEVIDLLTYTDNIDCQDVYWINGKRRGANTENFKQLLDDLKGSIDKNNSELFKKQLPETLNMECSAYFEEELYVHIFNYERDLQSKESGSRKLFLKYMLDLGSSNLYAYNDICDTLSNAIFKKQTSPQRYESIQLAQLFLNKTDTGNLNCSFGRVISDLAQYNQPVFLTELIEIEVSSSFDEAQSNFQDTVINAIESAVEIGNKESVDILVNYLSDTEEIPNYSSKQLLKAAGRGGSIDMFELIIDLNLTIDYSQYEVLEAALRTGNPQIVKRLFDIGFIIPEQSYAKESLLWNAFIYEKLYLQKDSELLFKLLIDNEINFALLEEQDRFILMDRVYTFAQAAWVDSYSENINYKLAMRYKKAVIELTNTYFQHASSIDYQYGREQQTLLMNAVEGNLPEVVALILKQKPNLELKNKEGKTALNIATQEARIYILGSRKGFDKVYKENAQELVALLGGDISPFNGMIK